LSFEFIRDPGWVDLDEETKNKVLALSFSDEIESDPEWNSLPAETQDAVRSIYFEDAKKFEKEFVPKKYNILGGVKDVGKLFYDIPVNFMGAAASLFEDDNPEAEYDWKDIARRAQEERNKMRMAEPGGEEYALPWIKRRNIREAGASSGFSGVAMGAGLLGYGAGTLVPAPGTAPAGALAASGVAAYRMDKAMFSQQIIDAYRQDNPNATQAEIDTLMKRTRGLRSKHALWEAIPEAAGNLAQISGIGAIFKAALGKKLGARLFQSVAGMYGVEIGTETITQMGQENVEIEAGLSKGQKRSFASFDDLYESFKEVAPQTFILVSLMGGAGAAAGKSYQIIANPPNAEDASIINPIIARANRGEISAIDALQQVADSDASDKAKDDATRLLNRLKPKKPTTTPMGATSVDEAIKNFNEDMDDTLAGVGAPLEEIVEWDELEGFTARLGFTPPPMPEYIAGKPLRGGQPADAVAALTPEPRAELPITDVEGRPKTYQTEVDPLAVEREEASQKGLLRQTPDERARETRTAEQARIQVDEAERLGERVPLPIKQWLEDMEARRRKGPASLPTRAHGVEPAGLIKAGTVPETIGGLTPPYKPPKQDVEAIEAEIEGKKAPAKKEPSPDRAAYWKKLRHELNLDWEQEDAEMERRAGLAPREARAAIDADAAEAATAPENDLPEPTQAQKEAGNYKKGHIRFQGLEIAVENPRGAERSGTDESGKKWSVKMKHHYGYFNRTEGKDGEQIDVFVGPHVGSKKVFIVDQVVPGTDTFDEHKTLIGFKNEEAARAGYLANYEKGWKGLGAITELPMDEFKEWIGDGTRKIQAYSDEIAKEEPESIDEIKRSLAGYSKPRKHPNWLFADGFGVFLARHQDSMKAWPEDLKERVRKKARHIYGFDYELGSDPIKQQAIDEYERIRAELELHKRGDILAPSPRDGWAGQHESARGHFWWKDGVGIISKEKGKYLAYTEGIVDETSAIPDVLLGEFDTYEEAKKEAEKNAGTIRSDARSVLPGKTQPVAPDAQKAERPGGRPKAVAKEREKESRKDLQREEPGEPGGEVQVIDEEGYLALHGAGRQDIGEAALHKNIGTGKAKKKLVDAQAKKDNALIEKRERLRKEYKAKVESGEIRPPTRDERLAKTAAGHPDNEATQAAKRLLEKKAKPKPKIFSAKVTDSKPGPPGKWDTKITVKGNAKTKKILHKNPDLHLDSGAVEREKDGTFTATLWDENLGVTIELPGYMYAEDAKNDRHAVEMGQNNLSVEGIVDRTPPETAAPPAESPEPAVAPGPLSQRTIKTLLSFPPEMRVHPTGPSLKDFRQNILEELTGTKPPKSKSGAGAVRDAILKAAGISKEGKAPVEYEREAVEWLKSQVGFASARKVLKPREIRFLAQNTERGREGETLQVIFEISEDGRKARIRNARPSVHPNAIHYSDETTRIILFEELTGLKAFKDKKLAWIDIGKIKTALDKAGVKYETVMSDDPAAAARDRIERIAEFRKQFPKKRKAEFEGEMITFAEEGKTLGRQVGRLLGDIKRVMIKPEGKKGTTYLPDNRAIEFTYAIVEIDSLVTSNDNDLRENPAFPKELQPRDRDRKGAELQVVTIDKTLNPERMGESKTTSHGAPIVGNDSLVESGNGRTIAIRRRYDRGENDAYRDWVVENAEEFGLNQDAVSAMEKPILVRVRTTEVDRPKFVEDANRSEVARMSPTEQARADARNIDDADLATFRPSEEGNIAAASNRGFITRFVDKMGPAEAAGYLTEDGRHTKQLIDRVQAALFYKAYEDDSLISLMAEEADTEIKNILNALTVAAPKFVQARGAREDLGGYPVIENIAAAVKIVRKTRVLKTSVPNFFQQQGLFEQVPEEIKNLALVIYQYRRSAKRQGVFFKEIARGLVNYFKETSSLTLPGMEHSDIDIPSLIEKAFAKAEDLYGTEETSQRQIFDKQARYESYAEGQRARRGRTESEVAEETGAPPGYTLEDSEDSYDEIKEATAPYGGWISALDKPQRNALNRSIRGREDPAGIRKWLKKMAGSPWEREAIRSLLASQAIKELIAGKEPKFDSPMDAPSMNVLRESLLRNGEKAVWQRLYTHGALGHPSKPLNSINGSFVDCRPSPFCAGDCYATRGRSYPANYAKPELINIALSIDPAKTAEIIAGEYKATLEYHLEKALRMFDTGDGSSLWIPFVNRLNSLGVRVQMFSKKPELLRQISDTNLRLLSIDKSNLEVAEENLDLPIAFLYSGSEDLAFLETQKDRYKSLGGVILPLKIGKRLLKKKELAALPDWALKHSCPIDTGAKRVGDWNCTRCDENGGLGCFHKSVSAKVLAQLGDDPLTESGIAGQVDELKEIAEGLDDEARQDLFEELAVLLSAIRKGSDPGAESTSSKRAEEDLKEAERSTYRRGGLAKIDTWLNVEESLDLFGQPGPGQKELFDVPKGPQSKKLPQKKKVKAEPTQAQINLFTGEQDNQIQKGLFSPFPKGKKPVFKPVPISSRIQGATRRTRMGTTGHIGGSGLVAKTPDEVASLLSHIRKHAQEYAYTVTTDENGTILEIHKYSKGQKGLAKINAIEMAGHALNTEGASKVWFVHQHPSGVPEASDDDYDITRVASDILSLRGIDFSAIIIGGTKWSGVPPYEFDVDVPIEPIVRKQKLAVKERLFTAGKPGPVINNSGLANALIREKYGGQEGFIFLDSKLHELGFLPWPKGEKIKEAAAQVVAAAEHLNATVYVPSLNRPLAYKNRAEFIDGLIQNLQLRGLQIMDLLEQGMSHADAGSLRRIIGQDILEGKQPPKEAFEPLKSNDPLYATKRTVAAAGLTLQDIQKAFSKARNVNVGLSNDGSVWVRIRGGEGFQIGFVDRINFDEVAFETRYGRVLEDGEFAAGKYHDGVIVLQKDFADIQTLWHEVNHFVTDKYLNKTDNGVLKASYRRLYGKDRGYDPSQEDIAEFVGSALAERAKHRGTTLGRVIQKIADFLDGLLNVLKPTARSVLRSYETGKVFERTATPGAAMGSAFQKTAQRWYSQMEGFLSSKLPNKGTGKGYANTIQAWAKKGLIKPEELEWSGLIEWLQTTDFQKIHDQQATAESIRSQKEFDPLGIIKGEYDVKSPRGGQVAKKDVLDFLRENNVRIEEVEKGGRRPPDKSSFQMVEEGLPGYELRENAPGDYSVYNAEGEETTHRYEDPFEAATEAFENVGESIADPETGTKFSQHTLPGGENYRELLLTLPEREVKKPNPNLLKVYGPDSPVTKFEQPYTSAHWEEPNVLAHVRFNERTDAEGRKVLFIEELQSDWHQEGRKKGYKKGKHKFAGLTDEQNQRLDELWARFESGAVTPEERVEYNNLVDLRTRPDDEAAQMDRVPDAPFKKTWPLLAIKRMVRYAAENGFDAIGWTPGEVQAERYDLSKHVDSIVVEPRTDNEVAFSAIKDGKIVIPEGGNILRVKRDKLSDYIGKEASEKALGHIDRTGAKTVLKGLDLKVGGEGMKGFYDKILPSAVNKFFNKKAWGKAKVGETKIPDMSMEDPRYPWGDKEKQIYSEVAGKEVWTLPITPEMRHKAMYEGMPQFETKKLSQHNLPIPFTKETAERAAQILKKKVERQGNIGGLKVSVADEAAALAKPGEPAAAHDKRVRGAHNLERDSLSVLEAINAVFSREGLTHKGKQDLSYFGDLITSIPSFFKDKIHAVRSMFNATQERQDDYHENVFHLENHDDRNVGTAFAALRKSGRSAFKEVQDYLIERDRNNLGYRVKENTEIEKFEVYGPDQKMVDFFNTETEAVEKALQFEAEDLRKSGYDPGQVDAIMAFRMSTNKGFDLLFEAMKRLLEAAPETQIPIVKDGKPAHVNLREAMAIMGDMRGFYFPRIRRRGKIVLTATKKGEDSILETFNLESAMKVARAKYRKQGYKVTTSKSKQLGEDVFELSGELIKTQQLVNAALDRVGAAVSAAGKEDIESIIKSTEDIFATALAEQIANVIRERGSRVHMTRRAAEYYKGFEEDPQIAIGKYIQSLAGGHAKRRMIIKMLRAFTGTETTWKDFKEENPDAEYEDYRAHVKEMMIDQREQPNAFKWGKAYIAETTRNREFADEVVGTVKGLAVAKYLAFRVFSAPLVNLTALATSVPASMKGVGIPLRKTPALLTSAINKYRKYKFGGKVSAGDRWVFDTIKGKGWDHPQFNSESLSVLRSRLGRGWDKALEVGMFTFSESERLNRVATIAATYQGLRDLKANKGKSRGELIEMAKQASDDSHGIYNKGNHPYLALGANPAAQIVRMFYVFRTFSHTYLMNMKKLGFEQKDYAALSYLLASPAILAGGGATVLAPIISAILKGVGVDEPEEGAYKKIGQSFGPGAERLARFGLAGAAGFSIKGSLSIGIGDLPTTPKDILGAPGSVISDIFLRGIPSVARGDVSKGFEKILPTGFGNTLRAHRERTAGLTTRTNAPVFFGPKPVKLTIPETFYRALSLNPARIATIQEVRWNETKLRRTYAERRSDIYNRIRKHIVSGGSAEGYAEILADIYEYNERAIQKEQTPITRKTIKASLRRAFRPSKRERRRKTGLQARIENLRKVAGRLRAQGETPSRMKRIRQIESKIAGLIEQT